MADSVGFTGLLVSSGSAAGIPTVAPYFHTQQAPVTLSASSAKTVTAGTWAAQVVSDYIKNADALHFVLNLTAVSVPTSLDVEIETLITGTLWAPIARFTQIGAGPTATQLISVNRRQPPLAADIALKAAAANPGTGVLTTSGLQWTDTIRVGWAVVGTSYTFSVVAIPLN